MLSDGERAEIDRALAESPDARAACIDALKIVQRHRGWVSDEALDSVAEALRMDPAELDGVATFYNIILREPVGRHVIRICDSVSCWLLGYEQVRDDLLQRLSVEFAETTADERFTVLPIVCLGACDHAPVCMVDEDLHLDLTPGKLEQMLAGYE